MVSSTRQRQDNLSRACLQKSCITISQTDADLPCYPPRTPRQLQRGVGRPAFAELRVMVNALPQS